ncbi:MAG: hypothetical protein HC889_15595 [Synechococcaceae cyanobacterium SM1_2_3]|nr:hypothetical protein [Synechococcaceae cyanobacterium SM1_2_3]
MFELMLVLHLLGAALWTGGNLVLALGVLPDALRQLAWHIAGVTTLSVLFVVVGAGFRTSGLL